MATFKHISSKNTAANATHRKKHITKKSSALAGLTATQPIASVPPRNENGAKLNSENLTASITSTSCALKRSAIFLPLIGVSIIRSL